MTIKFIYTLLKVKIFDNFILYTHTLLELVHMTKSALVLTLKE